ncbi:lysM and putative peptidoglycan-binding domain-containing protein 2 isoform X1 [Lingula anatina]|uniref:LysM and putative peptidoglycan-binding domain-containing protein 2 isoform X1 n=1 Tax=Lingula anatina TaxID=7574 RepID=A0A1S3JLB3_LINAN|nr:lysM and putative peptidoglycan-binding domain-containing protein 2 isoform X1 [Lingula anatina]|eukprot:XP_013411168.1 lysM and putative peptidoglycan-binding domain-containing protein 2 isoform X1 [Lingula anatina]
MATEKKGLGQFVKKQAKYGSTTKTKRTNEKYITHKIEPGDTLQGLALKYEIPMQDLKRANKMWTNDSLFLRETLLIPVTSSSPEGISGEPATLLTTNRNSPNGDIDGKTENSHTANSDIEASSITAQDFLSRFDTTLAQLKTNVQKLEDRKSPELEQFQRDFTKDGPTVSMFEDETNPLSHLPQRRTKMGSRQRPPSLESDPMAVPETVVTRPRARTKQLENSSELFEKKQDEFFEL